MEKINKTISSLPVMYPFSPFSFFESSVLKNNKLFTKRNSIFNTSGLFNSFFRDLLLPQHKHPSCNTLTDEINLYASTPVEMSLSDLSDVEINSPTNKQQLRFVPSGGDGTWVNYDATNQLYTDFIVRMEDNYLTWESQKIELPKDRFGAYDLNCTIEFFTTPTIGPLTPHKVNIIEEDNEFYLTFVYTNMVDVTRCYFNGDWVDIKVRIWKNNPELEIVSGQKEDTIWVEANVPGNDLGEYYATVITLNENLTPGTLMGYKIDSDGSIIEGNQRYDRVSVSIPFLGGGTVFLSHYCTAWLFEDPTYVGLYTIENGEEIPLTRVSIGGRAGSECRFLPQKSDTQAGTDWWETILNKATHFRIYNGRKDYYDDHEPDNDRSVFVVIQNVTNLGSEGICEYCYKRTENYDKWVNNWITESIGKQNNNFLCLNQVRTGDKIELYSTLKIEDGTTIYDRERYSISFVSDFIPIKPYNFGDYYGILTTITVATICFYDKDKNYLGYYASTDDWDSNTTMMLKKYFNPISSDKKFEDICYLRYTGSQYSYAWYNWGLCSLVFSPHEF